MLETVRYAIVTSIAAALLCACSGDRDTASYHHFSVLPGHRVAIHARGEPDAVVGSDGALDIDGKRLVLTPAHQAVMALYYSAVVTVRDDAIATGKAGVATASQALGSLASALAKGNADSIDAEVQKKAAVVEANAAKLCTDLAALRGKQDVAATAVPAFVPYAQVTAQEVADCRNG